VLHPQAASADAREAPAVPDRADFSRLRRLMDKLEKYAEMFDPSMDLPPIP